MSTMWKGLHPPQAIFSRKKFAGIVIDPPELEPGNWCGAGKLWIDPENSEYWLTSRPRSGAERRGFAAEIYRSHDGCTYDLVASLSKEDISGVAGKRVQSIENQQLLRDPSTGRYHLYLSLDVHGENIAGRAEKVHDSKWETFLLSADDPAGPWTGEGFALRGDHAYDSAEARDATIDIIDGRYIALYKARRKGSSVVNMAMAVSGDGKEWRKQGLLGLSGGGQPDFFLLNGSILPGSGGPVFVGIQTTDIIRGAALSRRFAAYQLDMRAGELEPIFLADWIPGSQYEHPVYPIHTYSTLAEDPSTGRWLLMIEAVDPTHSAEPGLNTEIDRLLLYVS